MDSQGRWAIAKKQKWYFLCLKLHQGKKRCDKPNPCKKCDKNHSTWLHPTESEGQELAATHRTISATQYEVLLATAEIKTTDIDGRTIRALIDSGSEGSMITEEAASRLQFKNKKSDKWIAGLNGNKSGLLKKVTLNINPRFESRFSLNVDDQELNECIKPQGVPIICQSKRPINNMQSMKSKCERELLEKKTEFNSHCRIKITQIQDTWIQLKEKNMWIYGLHNKTTLNIVYASEVDTITLQGSGKLEVSPGCEVVQHGFTMIGQAKVTTKGSMDFQPTGNLSSFIQNHPVDLKLVNVTMDYGQQLKELYSLMEHGRTSSEETQTQHRWQYGLTIVVIFTIFGLIIGGIRTGIIDKMWLRCQKHNHDTSIQHGHPLPIEADKSITTELNEVSVAQRQNTSSTATQHGPAGCPFRT